LRSTWLRGEAAGERAGGQDEPSREFHGITPQWTDTRRAETPLDPETRRWRKDLCEAARIGHLKMPGCVLHAIGGFGKVLRRPDAIAAPGPGRRTGRDRRFGRIGSENSNPCKRPPRSAQSAVTF
jgi:hypothetical protein